MSHVLHQTTANNNTHLLVFGFIRKIKIINRIVPSAIILLCIQFYEFKYRLICIKVIEPPNFMILDMEENKQYNGKLKNKLTKKNAAPYGGNCCHAKNFKLPPAISNLLPHLNKKHFYDIIFQIGGNKKGNGYIINYPSSNMIKEIDIFKFILPELSQPCYWTFLVYSNKYGLIEIGGKRKNFNLLSFDKWKWRNVSKMANGRQVLTAAMIDDDNLFCAGGSPFDYSGGCKTIDIYNFDTNKWTVLADMNFKRWRAGIFRAESKPNVYIAGGSSSAKELECYDIEKNKWMIFSNTNNQHNDYPILWTDNPNILNIASSTNGFTFEKMDLRQNKWETFGNVDFINLLDSIKDSGVWRLLI